MSRHFLKFSSLLLAAAFAVPLGLAGGGCGSSDKGRERSGKAVSGLRSTREELMAGRNVLVAAHGNSLRALVKMLEGIADDEITELNIPTGVPRLYELDAKLAPTRAEYLGEVGQPFGDLRRVVVDDVVDPGLTALDRRRRRGRRVVDVDQRPDPAAVADDREAASADELGLIPARSE